jgi:translation initiation factor 4G
MHHTGNRYVAGQSQLEDPDEEKKQWTYKGILNKLTTANFEKLLGQVQSNTFVQSYFICLC